MKKNFREQTEMNNKYFIKIVLVLSMIRSCYLQLYFVSTLSYFF